MIKYTLVPSPKFTKQLNKLDKYTKKLIVAWLSNNIHNCDDPRAYGKTLIANRLGQWRYRIGDYRVLVNIQDDKLIVLALEVGHRRDIY
jgi:mRNA interferase RelE/StbE